MLPPDIRKTDVCGCDLASVSDGLRRAYAPWIVDFRERESLPYPEVKLDKQWLHGGRFSHAEFHANDGCSLPCTTKGAGLDHKRHLVRNWRPLCTAPCGVFVVFRVTE